MVPGLLSQLDAMYANSTDWRLVKHMIHVIDVGIVNVGDRYEAIASKF